MMVMLNLLNNPVLTLQLGILLGLMGRIVKGCVREVYKHGTGKLYVYPHQWVCGRWPWGYGSAFIIITNCKSVSH